MKSLIFMLLTLFQSAAFAQSGFADLPKIEYFRNPYYESEGFKLGYIVDFHRSGFLIWSYEGEMMLGYGTVRKDYLDPYCLASEMQWINGIKDETKKQKALDDANGRCYMFTNPWNFSSLFSGPYSRYSQMDKADLTPVLLYYERPSLSIEHTITQTKNFVQGIYPVNSAIEIEDSYFVPESEMPIASNLNVRRGFTDGRIVCASLDHIVRKSFELIVQEGPSGGSFRKMSVSSQKMFDYIVKAMLSGKLVRVSYVELTGIENSLITIAKDYDTPFRVTGVEIRKDSSSTGQPLSIEEPK